VSRLLDVPAHPVQVRVRGLTAVLVVRPDPARPRVRRQRVTRGLQVPERLLGPSVAHLEQRIDVLRSRSVHDHLVLGRAKLGPGAPDEGDGLVRIAQALKRLLLQREALLDLSLDVGRVVLTTTGLGEGGRGPRDRPQPQDHCERDIPPDGTGLQGHGAVPWIGRLGRT
jgi:hypothetical protein